jgi:hypothetical protein
MGGLQSVAAAVARAVLVLWMVFFTAFDAVAGIAIGVSPVMRAASPARNGPAWSRRLTSSGTNSQLAGGEFSVLGNLGQGTWVVLANAATVTLWRRVTVAPSSPLRPYRCSSLRTPATRPPWSLSLAPIRQVACGLRIRVRRFDSSRVHARSPCDIRLQWGFGPPRALLRVSGGIRPRPPRSGANWRTTRALGPTTAAPDGPRAEPG